jgi:hypothetical protein
MEKGRKKQITSERKKKAQKKENEREGKKK